LPKVYRNSTFAHLCQGPRDWVAVRLRRPPRGRFVLFSQGRTGSSLLESLLAAHPEVHRSIEILSKRRRLADLHRFLDAASRRSRHPVWGAKIKVDQLEFQGVDPPAFLATLATSGWRLVHLWRRDTLRQSVSHFVRRHRGHAHRKDDRPETLRLRIEPSALLGQIESRLERLARERAALRDLPHVEVVYEDDLLRAERHQLTADRLFAFLGVAPAPVSTDFRKVTPSDLPSLIENWAEVRRAIGASPHASLLQGVESEGAGAPPTAG
jgi:hypothetical protein